MGGCTAVDTATPETEQSMMKQEWTVLSARVSVECGFGGTKRAFFRSSSIAGFFCLFSSQVSMSESFSRRSRVISS